MRTSKSKETKNEIPYTRSTRFIIIRLREQTIGLVVDAVSEVFLVSVTTLKEVPKATIQANYIRCISKQETGLLIVLDLEKILFETTEQGQESL